MPADRRHARYGREDVALGGAVLGRRAAARPGGPFAGATMERRRAASDGGPLSNKTGGDLLSQALSDQVPSALGGLTSLFGMGRGVSPPLLPPKGWRPALPGPQNRTAGHFAGYRKVPSSPRSISTGLLSPLLGVHIRPINLVVFQGSYSL